MRTKLTLEDQFEIIQLFARYGRCLDSGDADGYVALFTEDGLFARTNAIVEGTGSGLGPGSFQGRAALHRLVLDLAVEFRGKMRHQLTDVSIEAGVEEGEANAACYALITDWREGDGKLSMHGTYTVTLVQTPDGWRFRSVAIERLPAP